MKTVLSFAIGICLLVIHESSLAQDSNTIKKLAGSWIYFDLEATNESGPMPKAELEKAKKLNGSYIITFELDGHYQIWENNGGKKKVLASGETKLTNNGKHLKIEGLEGDIHTLNDKFLKFSSPDRPLMVFKKYIDNH